MNEIKILVCKYIYLIIFFLALNKGINNSLLCMIITLFILILSNIRTFYIKSDFIKYSFLIVEVVVITILSIILNFTLIMYILFITFDFLECYSKSKIITESVFIILILKDILIFRNFEIILGAGLILINYLMIKNIKELYESKIKEQELYDKIRISELELKKLNTDIEKYAQSSLEIAVLKERNRISREVHDSVGHVLSATMIQLSAMERISKISKNPLYEMIFELRSFVSNGFQDIKKAVRELKPDEYSQYEGIIRIGELCENVKKISGLNINYRVIGDIVNLNSKQGSNIYRIIQEVLSNAIKHSRASSIEVILNFESDIIKLFYKDDGIGVSKIEESGVGIKSIRERVKELQGEVIFESEINQGMIIKISIPREFENIYG
ncbi:MAG: sensor histidine kinase [Sarcina sp.]